MRKLLTQRIALGLFLAAACCLTAHSAAAQDAVLEGKFKLVVLSYGGDEFLITEITASDDGDFTAEVTDAQRFLPGASIESVQREGDEVTLVVGGAAGQSTFRGRIHTEGDAAGQVLGMFSFRGTSHPARLEPTDGDEVAPLDRSLLTSLREIVQTPDAKARVEGLVELLATAQGPASHLVYSDLLRTAEEAELDAEAVQGHVNEWLASAADYGDAWTADVRAKAIQALAGRKAYAETSLKLAQDALAELSEDADSAQQATVLSAVVSAARLADATDLADTAAARVAEIEAKLDAEYLSTVPPFEPAKFSGRDDTSHNRVVLLELFTGAECPPCVAADVAFDALLKTYQPAELVTLQYHLHIPGPDPLTNQDTIARSQYYALGGTPSPYFNGQDSAPGGGSMGGAEAKYGQYREVIDAQLDEAAPAEIDLKLTRSGDKIIIQAMAEAAAVAAGGDDAATEKPDLRLRLALSEESIRYVGGNGLRFHHHVVRALPGGAEGKALEDGRAQVEITIDVEEIRGQLQQYVDGYERGFSRPTPEIALKDLAVVAFVQNDADKNVLHAVTASVSE